jgi:hypothetical protein
MSEIRDLDLQNAKLAYTIIQRLLEHNDSVSDLVALLARAIDEDTQRALTNTPQWTKYMETRRELDITRQQIEKFTEELQKLENPTGE